MVGSVMVAYEWPHRDVKAVIAKSTAKDGIDFTSTNAYVSVTTAAYVDVRGIPKVMVNITNEHATRTLLYEVYGKIGKDNTGQEVYLYTGVVGGTGTAVETSTDGWDWIDVKVKSAVTDQHVTGFVEIKGRAM